MTQSETNIMQGRSFEEVLALEECLELLGYLQQVSSGQLNEMLSKISLRLIWLVCRYPSSQFRLEEYQRQVRQLQQLLEPQSPQRQPGRHLQQ